MIAIFIYLYINTFLAGVITSQAVGKATSKELIKMAVITLLFGLFVYIWLLIKRK